MGDVEIKTVKIRKKGQIVIPQDFRNELDLQTGEDLVLVRKGDEIILKKVKAVIKQVEQGKKIDPALLGLMKFSERTFAKDWSSKEDEIWDTY